MRIPAHPGKVLSEELGVRNLSANAFAKAIGVPANRISEIVRQRRAVTAETAFRFAAYFRNSPEFWLRLQIKHDLGKVEIEQGEAIKRSVEAAA